VRDHNKNSIVVPLYSTARRSWPTNQPNNNLSLYQHILILTSQPTILPWKGLTPYTGNAQISVGLYLCFLLEYTIAIDSVNRPIVFLFPLGYVLGGSYCPGQSSPCFTQAPTILVYHYESLLSFEGILFIALATLDQGVCYCIIDPFLCVCPYALCSP
jgi:hypothetical protein